MANDRACHAVGRRVRLDGFVVAGIAALSTHFRRFRLVVRRCCHERGSRLAAFGRPGIHAEHGEGDAARDDNTRSIWRPVRRRSLHPQRRRPGLCADDIEPVGADGHHPRRTHRQRGGCRCVVVVEPRHVERLDLERIHLERLDVERLDMERVWT